MNVIYFFETNRTAISAFVGALFAKLSCNMPQPTGIPKAMSSNTPQPTGFGSFIGNWGFLKAEFSSNVPQQKALAMTRLNE